MQRLDRLVLPSFCGLYITAGLLLPREAWPRALGSAGIALILAGVIATRLGRGNMRYIEPLAVTMAAAAVLALPTFPAFGGAGHSQSLYGALGSQLTCLVWVGQRWKPPTSPAPHHDISEALGEGLTLALGLSLVALVPVLGLVAASPVGQGLVAFGVFPSYLAGGVLAAIAYWALQRVSHTVVGRYCIGMLGGMCVYGAAAPIAFALKGEHVGLQGHLIVAYIGGSLVGPPLALSWDDL